MNCRLQVGSQFAYNGLITNITDGMVTMDIEISKQIEIEMVTKKNYIDSCITDKTLSQNCLFQSNDQMGTHEHKEQTQTQSFTFL